MSGLRVIKHSWEITNVHEVDDKHLKSLNEAFMV